MTTSRRRASYAATNQSKRRCVMDETTLSVELAATPQRCVRRIEL